MKEYFKRHGKKTADALWDHGPEWQTARRLVQRDLLQPGAAKSYADAIGEAASLASKGAPACGTTEAFDEYMARASFDMFSAAFLGRMTQTADPASPTADPKDVAFCKHAVSALDGFMPLFNRPQEMVLNHLIPGQFITTKRYGEFEGHMDYVFNRAAVIISDFADRKARGELNKYEQASYLNSTLSRQETEGKLSQDLFVELATILLTVDTTSAYTKWVVAALAAEPRVQQKVYEELMEQVGDAPLSTELVSRREWLPYLHAVKREAHRYCPALFGITKTLHEPITLCGYTIPAGERVTLDTYSPQNDEQILPDASEFKPERWLDDAVAVRKGTPAEVIDHTLLRGPFSAGARQCPASRVANIEVFAFVWFVWRATSEVNYCSLICSARGVFFCTTLFLVLSYFQV